MIINAQNVQKLLDGIGSDNWKIIVQSMETHEIAIGSDTSCVAVTIPIGFPDKRPERSKANSEFIAASPDIAREYLKLHEENTRLQQELNYYTATDYITAAKAYNLEMGLRHEAEKENTRLRAALESIVDLKPARLENGSVDWVLQACALNEIARDALKGQPK